MDEVAKHRATHLQWTVDENLQVYQLSSSSHANLGLTRLISHRLVPHKSHPSTFRSAFTQTVHQVRMHLCLHAVI